ncbi:BamA/TamA family outer membrane protein [Silvimonas amylolytica]|nr:BamA/TamA family outer membrane protein [Silvimonas amylolytica]
MPGASAFDWNTMQDPEDGAFDMSDYLLNQKGFLPVPTIITEPAIGYGGGAAILFFDKSLAEAGAEAKESGAAKAPPNITGVGGVATENGTWGGGIFHFHTWDGDRIRYLGAIAKMDLKTEYFGVLDVARSYTLSGDFLVQQVLFKVLDSPWYIGPRYTYLDANTQFTGNVATELGAFHKDVTISKLGAVVDYDTRDNIFWPNRGTYSEMEAQYARDAWGSSQDFDTYDARAYTWIPFGNTWVWGLRGQVQASSGDVPFYAQPYVDQRGVQKGRFQDKNTIDLETELRWNVTERWAALGFVGAGRAWGRWHTWDEAETPVGIGVGFRYLVARKLGLGMGIDIAHSRDQNAWYIQVGSAWR